MIKKVGIYSRVSTKDQTTIQQQDILKEFCANAGYQIVDVYVDEGESALRSNRPQYMRILEDARRRKIDMILCYKIDRFSRSVKELLNTMDLLKEYKVDFMSYMDKQLDTTSSSGKFMFQVLAAVSEFERNIISERTKLKLQHLKSKGVILGRPQKAHYETIFGLRSQGLSLGQIGKRLSLDRSTISKVLKKRSMAQMKGIQEILENPN
jgi:DNA invertase Pin-like site-specific DNA recombinase